MGWVIRLSIVTITMNDPEGLMRTLQSTAALKKALGNSAEQIIIDSSTLLNSEIKMKFCGESYCWIDTPARGIYAALNLGTAKSRGNIVWHLNGGDSLLNPETLMKSLDLLEENSQSDFLFSPVVFGKNGESWGSSSLRSDFKRNIFGINRIPHQGVLFRKSLFEKLGKFREDLKIAGDHDFFLRMVNEKYLGSFQPNAFAYFDMNGLSQKNLGLGIRESLSVIQLLVSNNDERTRAKAILKTYLYFLPLFKGLIANKLTFKFIKKLAGFI